MHHNGDVSQCSVHTHKVEYFEVCVSFVEEGVGMMNDHGEDLRREIFELSHGDLVGGSD